MCQAPPYRSLISCLRVSNICQRCMNEPGTRFLQSISFKLPLPHQCPNFQQCSGGAGRRKPRSVCFFFPLPFLFNKPVFFKSPPLLCPPHFLHPEATLPTLRALCFSFCLCPNRAG